MDIDVNIDVQWGHVRALPYVATTAPVVVIEGPCKFCGWSMRNAGGNSPGDFTTGLTASFLAAAAGSVLLPIVGAYVTGFDVTMAAIAAAAGGTVTLSNVAGGPYVYNFEGMVGAASTLSRTFDPPLQAVGGVPTLAISAIVGGGAGNLNIYGMSDAVGAVAQILDGGQILAEIAMDSTDSSSELLSDHGIHVYNQIVVNPIHGTMEGVIYARYQS
jgi:hypothetical protein